MVSVTTRNLDLEKKEANYRDNIMSSNKKYWKSEAELSANDAMIETLKQNEFVEQI